VKRIFPPTRLLWMSVAVLALACQQDNGLVAPDGQLLAKGGHGGKPGSGGTYSLLEYFIYHADGTNYIHVVGEGDVDFVNPEVVQDYFFNGIRDDNYSQHYEYTTSSPPAASAEPGLTPGTFHVDIPWNGDTRVYDPVTESFVTDLFRDFLIADLDGQGADPFTFGLAFQAADYSMLAGFQPQGVVMDGQETNMAETSVDSDYHTELSDVTSYATYAGAAPDGEIFLTTVSVDPSSVSCQIVTVSQGKGKNRTTSQVTQVSGHVSVQTGSSTGETPSAWVEMHFVDVTVPNAPVYTTGTVASLSDPVFDVDATLTQAFSGMHNSVALQFAVDYMFPTHDHWSYAYDPAQNANSGFTTSWAGPATQVGDPWPVALAPTVPIQVTCN
jgi:hypothetical protein